MGRLVLKYAGPEIDAMKAIAEASRKRSMADFQAVCIMYSSLFLVLRNLVLFLVFNLLYFSKMQNE